MDEIQMVFLQNAIDNHKKSYIFAIFSSFRQQAAAKENGRQKF